MTQAAAADIIGFDPFDPAFAADPYSHYRRLREAAPVYRTSAGLWVLTRHRDCAAALRDARFGHGLDGGAFTREDDQDWIPSFLVRNPPDHTRLRGLVSKAFTARTVERLRPRVERLVDQLLDTALETASDRGSVDVVEGSPTRCPSS